jgi:hypothetical protein
MIECAFNLRYPTAAERKPRGFVVIILRMIAIESNQCNGNVSKDGFCRFAFHEEEQPALVGQRRFPSSWIDFAELCMDCALRFVWLRDKAAALLNRATNLTTGRAGLTAEESSFSLSGGGSCQSQLLRVLVFLYAFHKFSTDY